MQVHHRDLELLSPLQELALGGEIFDRIAAKEVYSEREARDVIRILLVAVGFMHAHGIVHR